MMSTYASVADYETYTELTVNTPSGSLQALLDQAERDIDKALREDVNRTDCIQGLSINGATGGEFLVTLPWGLYSYTSSLIPWDVDGDNYIGYLNDMTDPYGNPLPPDSWIRPQATYSDQQYAYGPLPATPIVWQGTARLGSQVLPLIGVDTTLLTGVDVVATVAQLVGGGLKVDPWQLAPSDMMALRRATCAQAEYRDQMGESFFTMAQWMSVSGPEFRTTGRRPRIGPRVMDELASTDLIQRGARAAISTQATRQFAYSPIGGLGISDDWRAI
jgi:hypothetical protein